MLLEAAIGDAYGSGYEFAEAHIYNQNRIKGYLSFEYGEGIYNRYTDDTQMAIGITELLIEKADWTPISIANKFVEVFKRDIRIGYAGRFFEFLKKIQTGEEFLEKIIPTSERNGASMRAFPLGVLSDEAEILAKAEIQARLTHNTDEGVYSAQLTALAAHYFLYDKGSKMDFEAYAKQYIPINWNFDWKGRVEIQGRQAILAALAAIRNYKSLSSILIQSIEYQGDVDTVATLAMAIGSVSKEIKNDLPKWTYKQLENEAYGRDFVANLDKQLMKLKQ